MPPLLYNKKARFNYEVLEELEAGIELLGLEVKALRQKKGKLEGARVVVRGGEAFVIGMQIPPYQPSNTPRDYDPQRARRLLLTRKEIDQVLGAEGQKGLTVVLISVYNKGRNLKVRVAIVRGKKKFDKRETLKKRDAEREMSRAMKRLHR